MRDKDVMRRAWAAVVGALLLVGAIAWTVNGTTLLENLGTHPRWYRVAARDAPVDDATLDALRAQLPAAAATAPAWSMDAPRRLEPEIVQVHADYAGRQVFVLGSCAASARGRGDLRARFLPVLGGGACSFSAEYDVRAGHYVWFRFNDREWREPSGDPHWFQVRGGDWWVDPATTAKMRAQVLAATAGHPRPIAPYVARAYDGAASDAGPQPAPADPAPPEPAPRYFVVKFQGQLHDGRRVVQLAGNCMDIPFRGDLRDWFIGSAFDGGDCVFDATFDPATGVLEDFSFHGVA